MIVGFWQSQSFKMALEVGRFVPDFTFPLSRKPTALTAAYEKFFSGGATDFGEQDSQNFNCPTTSSHRPY